MGVLPGYVAAKYFNNEGPSKVKNSGNGIARNSEHPLYPFNASRRTQH